MESLTNTDTEHLVFVCSVANRPEELPGQLSACPEHRPAGPGRGRCGRRLRQLPGYPQPKPGQSQPQRRTESRATEHILNTKHSI